MYHRVLSNNDLLDTTEIMSPTHLANIFDNNNDDFLKNNHDGNKHFEDSSPGISDKINYSIQKAPENNFVHFEYSSVSKDLSVLRTSFHAQWAHVGTYLSLHVVISRSSMVA